MKSTPNSHSSGWGQSVPHAEMVATGIVLLGSAAIVAGVSILTIVGIVLVGGFVASYVFSLDTSK